MFVLYIFFKKREIKFNLLITGDDGGDGVELRAVLSNLFGGGLGAVSA